MDNKTVWPLIGGFAAFAAAVAISVLYVGNFRKIVTKTAHRHDSTRLAAMAMDSAKGEMPHDFGIDMVRVQGGVFTMGAWNGGPDEEPTHRVSLHGFFIGRYEITQDQWKAVMGTPPENYFCGDCPVTNVTWDQAQAFIDKLNEKTGKTEYALPTEAEWEYAARGGKLAKEQAYSGSDNLDSVGWYSDNSKETVHKVGSLKANELGIYDMSGNVKEWCEDWFGDYPRDLQHDPSGPDEGEFRVLRGGGWTDTATDCTASARSYGAQSGSFGNVGFRVAVHR